MLKTSARALLAAVLICTVALRATAEETYTSKVIHVEDTISSIAINPDGSRVAFATAESGIRIIDAASKTDVKGIKWGEGRGSLATFSPDGSLIALAANQDSILIWDAASAKLQATIKPPSPVNAFEFSADSKRVVVATNSPRGYIYDVAGGAELASLPGVETDAMVGAIFSPNGARVASFSLDKVVRIWDAASGKQLLAIPQSAYIETLAFSPDGQSLLVGTRAYVAKLYDATTGSERLALTGHEGDILAAAFSADGSRIATGSYDRTIRIWEASTGKQLVKLEGHLAEVIKVAFAPDASTVLSVARDGTARIWRSAPSVSLAGETAGLWAQSLESEEPTPPEIQRFMCLTAPFVIRHDGVVLSYQASEGEIPQPVQHLRCQSGSPLQCEAYPGAPAQGLQPQGSATLELSADKGQLCSDGNCLPIERCKPIEWTGEERASGFAKSWDEAVKLE